MTSWSLCAGRGAGVTSSSVRFPPTACVTASRPVSSGAPVKRGTPAPDCRHGVDVDAPAVAVAASEADTPNSGSLYGSQTVNVLMHMPHVAGTSRSASHWISVHLLAASPGRQPHLAQLHLAGSLPWQTASPGRQLHMADSLTWQSSSPGRQPHLADSLTWQTASPGRQSHLADSLTWQSSSPGSHPHLADSLTW